MMTAPSPSPSPSTAAAYLPTNTSPQTPSKLPIDFSPPLVAMVVVIAAAFVVVTYSRLISSYIIRVHRRWRRWRRRRRLLRSYVPSSAGDIESPPYNGSSFDLTDAFHVLSPYGLEESVIKAIPLTVYTRKNGLHDCAVCLLEFEENDYVRTLPVCYHAFHVDCIDVWLRSHANCPLCRALIFRPNSPFVPLMAARIRPSFDEVMIQSAIMEELPPPPITTTQSETTVGEITESEERFNGRDIMLKRSYSFGFERNLGSERLTMDHLSTASPWRYRRSGGFWSKRSSPFTSLTKPRVFSFRYYRGMKSPFIRRRSGGFFPVSESSSRYAGGGGGGSSRRTKSMASPMFMRSSGGGSLFFSSSRLRTGDPEALLSPERYNNRR